MNKLMTCALGLLVGCGALTQSQIKSPQQCSADFSAVRLQKEVRPSIVRVESDAGTGTGFVVKHRGDGILIVTNYHVIREGSSFDVVFDNGAHLANVEVVKAEPERDLALLKAPAFGAPPHAIDISRAPAELGERVAAMGYPYVEGESEPSLTLEDGSITNASAQFGGQPYITTNTNINPGNSGGPLVDGCGRAVGVVVAIHRETQRTGLIIPIDAVRTLVDEESAPQAAATDQIAARVQSLETAVRYRRGDDVAAMFSKNALENKAGKVFVASLEQTMTLAPKRVTLALRELARKGTPYRVAGHIITDFDALPPAQRGEAMALTLSPFEVSTVLLAMKLEKHELTVQSAMRIWLGGFVDTLFGSDSTFRVESTRMTGKHAATSNLTIGAASWVFGWVFERGDWHLDDYVCTRGCR